MSAPRSPLSRSFSADLGSRSWCRGCDNHVRVGRTSLENDLIAAIRREMLAPDRVERMAKELQELTARIERMRQRLKAGDPDLTADELQAAIERAEAKHAELEAKRPELRASACVVSILPTAAEEFRRQVEQGLDGDPRAALKARVVLRELFCGRIDLERNGEELWASYGLQPAALLQVVGHTARFGLVGNSGSGGPLAALFAQNSAPPEAVAGPDLGLIFSPGGLESG